MQTGILFKIFENHFRQLLSGNMSENSPKTQIGNVNDFTGYHRQLYISKIIPSSLWSFPLEVFLSFIYEFIITKLSLKVPSGQIGST
jgi:hypothetical protein